MNDELRAKLLKDLQHSGFYSEMVAIRTCVAKKWECHGGITYFDKDERATRECDFEAVKRMTALRGERRSVEVVARLLGQVKKSERPWIVFKDRHSRRDEDAWTNIVHTRNIDVRDRRIATALRRRSLVRVNRWKAFGAHEAFKRPSDSSTWYSAFITACKAAESASDDSAARLSPGRGIYFEIIKPIAVLDGMLVVADLDEDANLILTEVDSASFRFEFRSEAYDRPQYYLDLVTLKGLPSYLDLMTKRIGGVLHAFQPIRNER